MRAVDTNVLLRFVLNDDARQAERVRALLDRATAAGEVLFVSDVVLCEFAWVLGRSYDVRRVDLEAIIRSLAEAAQLTFESDSRLARALHAFAAGRGDFADYLIRERARDAGCDRLVTFDRALLREPGFVAP